MITSLTSPAHVSDCKVSVMIVTLVERRVCGQVPSKVTSCEVPGWLEGGRDSNNPLCPPRLGSGQCVATGAYKAAFFRGLVHGTPLVCPSGQVAHCLRRGRKLCKPSKGQWDTEMHKQLNPALGALELA